MDKSRKTGWWQLYLIGIVAFGLVILEGKVQMTRSEHHLILIITVLIIYWVIYRWVKNNPVDDDLDGGNNLSGLNRIQFSYRQALLSASRKSDEDSKKES